MPSPNEEWQKQCDGCDKGDRGVRPKKKLKREQRDEAEPDSTTISAETSKKVPSVHGIHQARSSQSCEGAVVRLGASSATVVSSIRSELQDGLPAPAASNPFTSSQPSNATLEATKSDAHSPGLLSRAVRQQSESSQPGERSQQNGGMESLHNFYCGLNTLQSRPSEGLRHSFRVWDVIQQRQRQNQLYMNMIPHASLCLSAQPARAHGGNLLHTLALLRNMGNSVPVGTGEIPGLQGVPHTTAAEGSSNSTETQHGNGVQDFHDQTPPSSR